MWIWLCQWEFWLSSVEIILDQTPGWNWAHLQLYVHHKLLVWNKRCFEKSLQDLDKDCCATEGHSLQSCLYPRQLENDGSPVWGQFLQHTAHGGPADLQEAEDDLRLKHSLAIAPVWQNWGLKRSGLCSSVFSCSTTALKRMQPLLFLSPEPLCLQGQARLALSAHFVCTNNQYFLILLRKIGKALDWAKCFRRLKQRTWPRAPGELML